MTNIIYIAIGGMIGAVSRYALSKYIYGTINSTFPWGTFIVNVIGCFLIGLFFDMFDKIIIRDYVKGFITIGFIGAFTTFSTYSLESVNLFLAREYKEGIMNIMLSNVTGIIAVVAGIIVSRIIFKYI